MSGFELGRVGIVLLALYLILQVFVGGAEVVTSRAVTNSTGAMILVVAIASWLGSFLIFGVLPAAILIANKDRLSRRWFEGEGDASSLASSRDLLQVGLVLMAFGGLWEGLVEVVQASMLSASLQSTSLAVNLGEAAATLRVTLSGTIARAAANLILGALLLWLAKPLAKRWL